MCVDSKKMKWKLTIYGEFEDMLLKVDTWICHSEFTRDRGKMNDW